MPENIVAIFPHAEAMQATARRLRESDVREISIISTHPLDKEDLEVINRRGDPIKYFTLLGGIAGLIGGIIFSIIASVLYPLPRGGRAITAIPPVIIISFETLILFGVLATFAGFLIMCRLPSLKKKPYTDIMGEGRFGILIKGGSDNMTVIEDLLKESSAEEIIRYHE